MEDVLTETPPPSRFFQDDLDNFAPSSPPLPSPFLLKNPNPKIPTNPTALLILLLPPTSLSLLPSPKSLTLVASLFLPELPLSDNTPINIYSLNNFTTLIASVACTVAADRSKAVAKLLLNEFAADRVVVFDSIRGENYRGRLAADEEKGVAFKLETTEERRAGGLVKVKGVEWLGSGSLVEGLGAAVMGECAMRRRKGTLVAALPEGGCSGGRRAAAGVLKGVMRGLGIEVGDGSDLRGAVASSSWLESDLYT